jgi:hypothetical protein
MFFTELLLLKTGIIDMRKYIILTVGLLCVCNSMFYAQGGVSKVGTTAAKFLSIDVGPRATAMGSAYVSVANDVSAMYWNPAGIARVDNFDALFSSSKWLADISFNYAGAVLPLADFGTLGINATFITMDPVEVTTTDYPEGTGEFVDAGMYAIGLAYARNLTDRFSIGFNVKYIHERVYQGDANGFALDVGTLFDTKLNGMKIGMSISNYGTKMKLDGQAFIVQHDVYTDINGNNETINAELSRDPYELPLTFRLGVSMDVLKGLYNSNLILSVDALHPSDDVESINIGGEYVYHNILSLRAGWKDLFKTDTEQSVVFGGGVQYELSGTKLSFDYSYLYFGKLPNIQMFSFGIRL